MNAVFARLAEPSTWAGLAAIATGIGQLLGEQSGAGLASIAAGLAAVCLPERRP